MEDSFNLKNNKKSHFALKHPYLLAVIIGILSFIITTYFTEIWTPQGLNPDFSIYKFILSVSITLFIGAFTRCISRIYSYFNDIISTNRYLKMNLANDVERKIKEELEKNNDTISRTFMNGLYRLLTDDVVRSDLETFDKTFTQATGSESPFRGVILDFIVRSLSSVGRKGFTVVDSDVSLYVKYISETVKKSSQIVMTCVVRPFWFVSDSLKVGNEYISLPPYELTPEKYGKGEHLRFSCKPNSSFQRLLVTDEEMIAEILLTAYLDMFFFEKVETCPICKAFGNSKLINKCPVHTQNRLRDKNIDDLPEIWWFDVEVNKMLNVDLVYTILPDSIGRNNNIFEDRIYISDPTPPLDIRFNFTSSENGNLKIKWGENAIPLAKIELEGETDGYRDPTTGERSGNTHRFFSNFKELLQHTNILKIHEHLKTLSGNLNRQRDNSTGKKNRFSKNIKKVEGESNRGLLANGDIELVNKIIEAIENLKEKIFAEDTSKLLVIYDKLVKHFKEKGIPEIFYLINCDPNNTEYPIRTSKWRYNWNGNGDKKAGILNAT